MRITRAVSLVVVTALLLTAAAVGAQTPGAQTPGAPAAPSMPPPPPPDYGVSITNEQAKKAMAGAEAEAKKNKWNVVIYILDAGGQPVMMQRLDGAQWGSV